MIKVISTMFIHGSISDACSIFHSNFHTLHSFSHMGFLEILFFFILLMFSAVHSKNHCPASACGNNTFQIRYPFKLEGQQPQNCNYTNVKCNSDQHIAVLNLPLSGDFYVRYIDYNASTVELHDPNNCLPRRLMNLNLQDSPFVAQDYQNFTFYNCPRGAVGSNLTAIECLSNSTNAVVVISSISGPAMEGFYGCSVISTSQVPVDSYYDGNSENLVLKWSVPVCKDCPEEKGRWKLKLISKVFSFVLMIPLITLLLICLFVCVACCIQMLENSIRARAIAGRQSTLARTRSLSTTFHTETSNAEGLDDSRIKSCSELVVLDINENKSVHLELSENLCCSICLESYRAEEMVRRISLCHHCFHADCIDQWLRKKSTCPICRVTVFGGKL